MLRRNVLVFHTGALGDFVLSWPLAMAAGRLLAQSRVMYVTARQKGLLAEKLLRVESIDSESGWHGLYGDGELPETARKTLEGAERIYSFVATDQWVANVGRINPEAKVVVMRGRPPGEWTGHASAWLVEALRADAVMAEGARQMIRSIRERGLVQPWPGDERRVLVHPGSGGESKCWDAENFLGVIEELKNAGREVRVVLGEVELERWSAEKRKKFEDVADVVTPESYVDLAEEIRRAGTFVGNDSGPGHLAAAMGARVVSVFVETKADAWAPIGPRVTVLTNPTVAEVVSAVSG